MKKILIVPFFLILISSCGYTPETSEQKKTLAKQDLEELNRYMVEKDRERIESFIERKGLSMQEDPTGLWYGIISEGVGELITTNDKVAYEYECSLLDGTVCYSSDNDGLKEIVIGKSEMEAGLDLSLRKLKAGGSGIFVLPPFMAYGLKGDGKNIPSRSVLVYKIKVRDVN